MCPIGMSSLQRRDFLKALSLVPSAWIPVIDLSATPAPIVFSCAPANDLYRVLTSGGASLPRYDTPGEAIARSPSGAGVLILAEGYPTKTTQVDREIYQTAREKKLRLYVEFASFVPGLRTGDPRAPERGTYGNLVERVVVTSEGFGPSLGELQLLDIHDCRYVPVEPRKAELVLARVAGFETAIYGVPREGVKPILFMAPEGEILIATTKLSQFVTGRYAPGNAWRTVWNRILGWLAEREVSLGEITPAVSSSFASHQRLAQNAGLEAFQRGVGWFSKAKMLVDRSWKQTVIERELLDVASPGPGPDWPLGDGSEGVLEGFSNVIEYDGSQLLGWGIRNDCTGETSMAMAFSSVIGGESRDRDIASNLNDFIYVHSPLAKGPRNDPTSASFGLVGWALPKSEGVYYGDDNARSLLGTIAAAALLESDRWDEPVLRCLLANLRTTGRLGFRGDSLDEKRLQQLGWRHFHDAETINYAPHFEAYLWACFLWAYHKTGYSALWERTRTAIRMTVAAYPNQWRWTNGLQQERARMLLPLAWLIRIEDKPEHRKWLKQIAEDLLALQDECGAIREEIGSGPQGMFGPPKSNDAYGTDEAPLIQENGDPACDLLYTSNFAFLGLHEAAAATGDGFYLQAEERLAEFLCRIQVRSSVHPELDGAWFRAFDFKRWDYWASNSDWGWGAWSIETGWTQAWITSVLALRRLKTSFWDLTATSKIGRCLDKLLPVLLPDRDDATPSRAVGQP